MLKTRGLGVFLGALFLVGIWYAVGAETAKPAKSAADFVNDGVKKYEAGDLAGALADFNTAAEKQKDLPQAVYGQAAVQFILGHYEQATKLLQKYLENNKIDNFAWMWSYVAEAHWTGQDKGTLSSMQAMTDEGTWFFNSLGLFLGNVTPQNYLKAAKETPEKERPEMLVRTYWLIGESYLLNDAKDKARENFDLTVKEKGPFQW